MTTYTAVGYRNKNKSKSKKKPSTSKRSGPINVVNKKKTATSKRTGPIKVSSASSKPKAKKTSTPKYRATTKGLTMGSVKKKTAAKKKPVKSKSPVKYSIPDKNVKVSTGITVKRGTVKKPTSAPKAKRSFRSGTNKPTDMAKRYVGNKNTKPRKSYWERKGLGNRLADWDWD